MDRNKVKNVSIKSIMLDYENIDGFDGEVEQVLSIDSDGGISLTSKKIDFENNLVYDYKYDDRIISTSKVDEIYEYLGYIFDESFEKKFQDGKSYFELILTIDDKVINIKSKFFKNDMLSKYIRKTLDDYNLLLFDGEKNYYHIESIYFKYDRILSKNNNDDKEDKYIGMAEELIINRKDKSIIIMRVLPNKHKVKQRFELEDEVISFLEYVENFKILNYFDSSERGSDSRIVYDENDKRSYMYLIKYDKKDIAIRKSFYNKKNLPLFYNLFVEGLTSILEFYGTSDLLNSKIYQKILPRENEFIYCSVIFSDDGKSYYYRTNDLSVDIGDLVIVGVGDDDNETIAKVVKIECFTEESLPLPLDKTKVILGKFN